MSEHEQAYRKWRRAAEKGYGKTTSYVDQQRIDARIRKLKETYETALAAFKEAGVK